MPQLRWFGYDVVAATLFRVDWTKLDRNYELHVNATGAVAIKNDDVVENGFGYGSSFHYVLDAHTKDFILAR